MRLVQGALNGHFQTGLTDCWQYVYQRRNKSNNASCARVLKEPNRYEQAAEHSPPAMWHKDSLSWSLHDVNWFCCWPIWLLCAWVDDAEPADCLPLYLGLLGQEQLQDIGHSRQKWTICRPTMMNSSCARKTCICEWQEKRLTPCPAHGQGGDASCIQQGQAALFYEARRCTPQAAQCKNIVGGRKLEAVSAVLTSFGVSGGNNAQRLCPYSSAFHALVANGSTCSPVPLRAGPITNHLQDSQE